MKIEGNGIKTAAINGSKPDDKGLSARADARSEGSPTSSTVQLSTLSARMRDIETRLGETGVVNSARVGEIKQAMAEGRFKVNPEAVADRLIDTVRELINTGKAS